MNDQKGSIIIFTILILGVILTITLALGNIFLPRLRTSTEAKNSVAATYAADSVLEWCLYTQRGKLPALEQPTMNGGATFSIYYPGNSNTTATCATSETPINHRAVGTYQGVSRSFLVSEDQGLPPTTTATNVMWVNPVGVLPSGNNLTKTNPSAWDNSGANSSQQISYGDGYIEFTTSELNTYREGGLSHNITHDYNLINYGWYLTDIAVGGLLYAVEAGPGKYTGTYNPGDVLRIAVESGVVKFYQNGNLRYTSFTPPVYPLYFDTTFYSNGSTINNAKITPN